jgi:hypothetical protein
MNANTNRANADVASRRMKMEEKAFPAEQKTKELQLRELQRKASEDPYFAEGLKLASEQVKGMGSLIDPQELLATATTYADGLRRASIQGTSDDTNLSKARLVFNPETGRVE